MSDQVENLVPKLRFPEYQDSKGWSSLTLGDIATFYKGKGLPKSSISDEGKTPCIHYGELFTHYSEVIDNVSSKTNTDGDYFLSKENDVLMPTSDVTPTGLAKASCITINEVVLGGDILVIRTSKSQVSGKFLSRLIRRLQREVLQLVSGSTIFHLYASSLEKLKITLPTLEEQQKIADCLSSLDDLITEQTKKVEALKQHKKGLMQKLFPAEGETIPKLRFPEFKNAGNWKEKKLGDICDYWNGGSYEAAITENGEFFLITLNSIDIFGNLKSDMKRVSETNNSLQKNDLVMVLSDVAHGNFLGLTDIIPNSNYVLNQRMAGLRVNNLNAWDVVFLRAFINANQYYFKQKGQGSSQQNLAKSAVTDFPVLFPILEEQQKVADCLSSIDDLITAQHQKGEALKQYKKGLMQQLFPSLDKV